mgnify:CR=1 FL=1
MLRCMHESRHRHTHERLPLPCPAVAELALQIPISSMGNPWWIMMDAKFMEGHIGESRQQQPAAISSSQQQCSDGSRPRVSCMAK